MNLEHRLILENQLALLGTLRVMLTGLADRNMLDDNALQIGRIDSQIAKTRITLGADDLARADQRALVTREDLEAATQRQAPRGSTAGDPRALAGAVGLIDRCDGCGEERG